MKQTVSTVSEHISPRMGHTVHSKTELPKVKITNEVTSNFPLQVALFMNINFFPIWLTTIIVMLPLKYERLPDLNKIILIIVLTASTIIEMTRLYMGYLGNLRENIPGLAGFWMLSVLLQTPLQLLLLHSTLMPSLVECVTQTVMCSLLAVQMITGFWALARFAKHSSAKFHVSQFILEDKE